MRPWFHKLNQTDFIQLGPSEVLERDEYGALIGRYRGKPVRLLLTSRRLIIIEVRMAFIRLRYTRKPLFDIAVGEIVAVSDPEWAGAWKTPALYTARTFAVETVEGVVIRVQLRHTADWVRALRSAIGQRAAGGMA